MSNRRRDNVERTNKNLQSDEPRSLLRFKAVGRMKTKFRAHEGRVRFTRTYERREVRTTSQFRCDRRNGLDARTHRRVW
jgi:hypothetical protein